MPVKPGVTLIAVEPLVPVPVTCSGAAAATGCHGQLAADLELAVGSRSSEPKAYWSKAALVRVKVTV